MVDLNSSEYSPFNNTKLLTMCARHESVRKAKVSLAIANSLRYNIYFDDEQREAMHDGIGGIVERFSLSKTCLPCINPCCLFFAVCIRPGHYFGASPHMGGIPALKFKKRCPFSDCLSSPSTARFSVPVELEQR